MLFFDRITSIYNKLEKIVKLIATDKVKLTSAEKRIVKSLYEAIKKGLRDATGTINELLRVRQHLSTLTCILSSIEESFECGVKRLINYKWELERNHEQHPCGPIESTVIQELAKYIATKGELLMNYRKVPGAPNTNNFQELEFKTIKYILRRILGYSAAKEYLYAHGERILFVDPKELKANIHKLLCNADQGAIRKIICSERKSQDSWVKIIREKQKWGVILAEIDVFLEDISYQLS